MMENVDTVGCCSPCCTHNTCFPDCCGMCGESAIVHSSGCCGCLCKRWKMIPGLKSAREFVDATRHAKSSKVKMREMINKFISSKNYYYDSLIVRIKLVFCKLLLF